ncbi:MAG: hypothetical protein N4A64_01845 [Marinisporobacter sp.]|jgi:hypothetical protein|nr:hypothetical protein [Marinisporobacter sp.]
MNDRVETPYGKRYKESHDTTVAFFMTALDEYGNRILPEDVLNIILEGYMDINKWREDE